MRKLHYFIVKAIFIIGTLGVLSACNGMLNSGNVPPPDPTVSANTLHNYVNKIYISLLGREPTKAELEMGILLVNENNCSMVDRRALIEPLMSNLDYYNYLYKLGVENYMNFIFDTSTIATTIKIWEALPADRPGRNEEIGRLKKLASIPTDLAYQNLNPQGLQRRLVHNSYYDFVNMGTENFVVSIYQNFFFRMPTLYELEEGTRIVDGEAGEVFLQNKESKSGFLDAIFSSDEYHEGQVRELFNRYLYREPDSKELFHYTKSFKEIEHYQTLQRELLSLDEFVGI